MFIGSTSKSLHCDGLPDGGGFHEAVPGLQRVVERVYGPVQSLVLSQRVRDDAILNSMIFRSLSLSASRHRRCPLPMGYSLHYLLRCEVDT
jgi:hypothetical protein